MHFKYKTQFHTEVPLRPFIPPLLNMSLLPSTTVLTKKKQAEDHHLYHRLLFHNISKLWSFEDQFILDGAFNELISNSCLCFGPWLYKENWIWGLRWDPVYVSESCSVASRVKVYQNLHRFKVFFNAGTRPLWDNTKC